MFIMAESCDTGKCSQAEVRHWVSNQIDDVRYFWGSGLGGSSSYGRIPPIVLVPKGILHGYLLRI